MVFEVKKDVKNCRIIFKSDEFGQIDKPVVIDPTPDTGAVLPLCVLGCALVCGGIFYYVSKKSKKMHKI